MVSKKPKQKDSILNISYNASKTASAFHKSNAFVRGIMGPVGCVAGDTMVATVDGLVRIDEISAPTHVLSWCGKTGQFVFASTGGSFPKGKDYLYRIVTEQGEFEAAPHHLLLCGDGKYRRVDTLGQGQSVCLYSSAPSLTNSSLALLSSKLDVRRLKKKAEDCLRDYAVLARQYGQQLLKEEGSAQSFSPSKGGVRKCSQLCECAGAPVGSEQEHSHHCQLFYRRSKKCSCCQSEPPRSTLAGRIFSKLFSHTLVIAQLYLLSLLSFFARLPVQLFSLCSRSYNIPPKSTGTILSITKGDVKKVYWDIQVSGTNNYVTADGAIHHNSGKSVGCIWEIYMRAMQQAKAPDGKRYTRWVIVRNTYADLRDTTIASWDSWFPEEIFGNRLMGLPPYKQTIEFNDVHMEVLFMALNDDKDIRKLLSLEPTGIWFNEAREIPWDIISRAGERPGRYPDGKLGGCTWSGIIMDTNPMDDEHWWYKMAEEENWRRDKDGKLIPLEQIPEGKRWEFFRQPSGLSEEAENLENLMQTPETLGKSLKERRKQGRQYYERMIIGKTQEEINVYVHGNYGSVQTGRAVFKGYWNDELHVAKGNIEPNKQLTVYCGLDCSGRNPAAVFSQAYPGGGIEVFKEVSTTDMGAEEFADYVSAILEREFKGFNIQFWGDPAGGWKSQNNEETYFDVLKSRGILVRPASEGLRFPPRREAVVSVLSRMSKGKPAFLLDSSCKVLRRGFNGGYYYKKFNTAGGNDYHPEPEKRGNRCADAMDALMYALVGMGEVRKMRGKGQRQGQVQANWGFDV